MCFIFDWAQRKLGDYITVNKIKNKENNHFIPYSISNKWGFIPQEKQFGEGNTYSKTNKATNYIVEPNTFAYNPARINVGSIAYQNNQFPVIVSSLYEIFKAKKNLNDEFLMNWFKTEKFTRQIQKLQEGGVRQYFFIDKMQESRITIPFISEQEEISKTLNQISNLIKLQQRKLDQLKLVHKGLLHQLLKHNATWKEVKIKEILNVRNKQIFPNESYPLMSFVQNKGVIPKGKRYNRDFLVKGSKKYKMTEIGDFIYSSNNLETGSIGINKTGKAVISPVYSIFSSKNHDESQFIGLLAEDNAFIYKMLKYRQGVVYGQWKIPEKDFLNIQIKIPNLKTRERILALFTNLDNLFNQEKGKLNYLKRVKKFLLQNMFI
ncbi:restriction endonuclease subunit S [Lactobacillus crispatus]|uniref:restriction endonuclease subunit S n=2 Tax=Lactobacillus crispatus TaxID=47770 RepID=UPI0027E12FD1|nr:restriction endonuclease subunit S [Lactobacillus crispatus]